MVWKWRIDLPPGSPEYNMAEDAALLAEHVDGSVRNPTFRVYSWDRDCVSIGRLQREDAVRQHFPGLPIVRRPTGGRAVLHGDDLTLSATLRRDHLPADCRSVLQSYRFLADGVKQALTNAGLNASYGSEALVGQHDIVDCFLLSTGCDLIEQRTGRKLMGSAQRREGAALLQQMSIPLSVIPNRNAFLSQLMHYFGI